MHKKHIVTLTDDERSMLKKTVSNRSPNSSVALNAQILLAADTNGPSLTDEVISATYHSSAITVRRIRQKFVLQGLDIALKGLPRGPQKRRIKIDGDVEAHLFQLACSEAPEGYAGWTLRLLADKAVELNYVESISHEAVRLVLKKTK